MGLFIHTLSLYVVHSLQTANSMNESWKKAMKLTHRMHMTEFLPFSSLHSTGIVI